MSTNLSDGEFIRLLGELAPKEVLYEFDSPRIFTSETGIGSVLVYQCAEDGPRGTYLVAPTNDYILADLKSGCLPVRDALTSGWAWKVEIRLDAEKDSIMSAVRVDPRTLDERSLPKPGTMLWPSLQPLLRVKAEGPNIKKGAVAPSVIRYTLNAGTNALGKMFEVAQGDLPQLPPSIQKLQNLRAQHVALNSFEIAFRVVDSEGQPELDALAHPDAAIQKLKERFVAALEWAADDDSPSPKERFVDAGERRLVLEAIKDLSPAPGSDAEQVTISGRLFEGSRSTPRGGFKLSRSSSDKARHYLKEFKTVERERVETLEGKIDALDKEKKTFVLRDIKPLGGEKKCSFIEEVRDTALDAFYDDRRVRVTGTVGRTFRVSILEGL